MYSTSSFYVSSIFKILFILIIDSFPFYCFVSNSHIIILSRTTLFSITKSPPTSGFLLMPVDSVLFPLLYFYSAFKLFARLVSNAAISGFPRTFIKRSASTPSGTATVFAVWPSTAPFICGLRFSLL